MNWNNERWCAAEQIQIKNEGKKDDKYEHVLLKPTQTLETALKATLKTKQLAPKIKAQKHCKMKWKIIVNWRNLMQCFQNKSNESLHMPPPRWWSGISSGQGSNNVR